MSIMATNIVSRMTMERETLGNFEKQVLLTVLRLGGEAYSVPVVEELEERTGREVAQAAVFIVLRCLEKKGLLRSRLDGSTAQERGRVPERSEYPLFFPTLTPPPKKELTSKSLYIFI